MKKWTLFLCLSVGSCISANAQSPVSVEFLFHNAAQPVIPYETMQAINGVNYHIQNMAFYMSRVQLIHDGNQVITLDTNEVFCVKMNAPVVNLGVHNVTNLEGIRFDVGVPVYLNHLDISLYHGSHPLSFQDPAMHWGWAAGYMHMVMNGLGDSNADGVPDAGYELHNLGNENVPSTEVMTVATNLDNNAQRLFLICNVDEWLRGTNPATTGAAHGSDAINAMVMQNVVNYPVFTSPANASIVEKEQIEVSVAQSTTGTTVSWTDGRVNGYTLTDGSGRIIQRGNCTTKQVELTGLKPGLHLILLENDKHSLIGTAKWIVP